MNIREELLKERSKGHSERIAAAIGSGSEKFNDLVQLMLSGESPVSQRAAWVMSKCVDKNSGIILPHIELLVRTLKNNNDNALKRCILRALQAVEIPQNLFGITTDQCFKFLESNKEAIAIKVFAMSVLFNICQQLPDLKNELRLILEDQLPYGSAGFKSRAQKILREL